MPWLGSARGHLSDWTTQQWVRLTGRRTTINESPWLAGLTGPTKGIGPTFFTEVAAAEGWQVRRDGSPRGLVSDFSVLDSASFDPPVVHPSIAKFYEQTSLYEMDAWAEWCGAFRPFGAVLASLFSRRLQQLNVPLSPLDTSLGIRSEVLHLIDPADGELKHTAWVRVLEGSGNVLYAGSYTHCRVPGYEGTCLKVVFPLPNGNAMVIMRPVAHPDGSFSVVSAGAKFGDPGFYFTVHTPSGVYARYLRALKESIRVHPATNGVLRADHVLTLWGATFLRLHYRLQTRPVLEA